MLNQDHEDPKLDGVLYLLTCPVFKARFQGTFEDDVTFSPGGIWTLSLESKHDP